MSNKINDEFELSDFAGLSKEEDQPRTRRRSFTTTWNATKTWYSRTVLRSGKGYGQLPNKRAPKPTRFHGWALGALLSCILVGICLILNLTVTIYIRKKYPPDADNLGVLLENDCKKIRSQDSKLHYAINAIATALVSASNYNMQCLTSPTRSEVDMSHAKRKWLDIGVHSVRNLPHISKPKALLWLALLVSTLPLHLFWNSAVFMTTTFNEYGAVVVADDFLASNETPNVGIDCSAGSMDEYRKSSHPSDQESYTICWLSQLAQDNRKSMNKMDPKQCMSAYESGLEGSNFNLLLVAKEAQAKKNTTSEQSKTFPPGNATWPVVSYFRPLNYTRQLDAWCTGLWGPGDKNTTERPESACQNHPTGWEVDVFEQSYFWMCDPYAIFSGKCSSSAAQKNASSWNILPEHYEIDHCLATTAEHKCQLQYSPIILYIALICNFIKFGSIISCLLISREPILVTIGDAAASFLANPDIKSKGRCTVSKTDDVIFPVEDSAGHYENEMPQPWLRDDTWIGRWYQGASINRWGLCLLLWFSCITVALVFLVKGIRLAGIAKIFTWEFGALNVNAIVNTSTYTGGTAASIITTSLIANLPQLLLSGLYFMYNAVMTGMASAYEWSMFAYERRTLRVTAPSGAQRETYWLQLPWKYSLPLVACSGVLHWLISQSIFLSNIRIYQPNNELLTIPTENFPSVSPRGVITSCGYSPVAIFCTIGAGTFMVLVLLLTSFSKLRTGITAVGNSSFLISAACHPPAEDTDAATKLILWGAVRHEDQGLPGHCCLTSVEVEKPHYGKLYAG